MAELFGKQTRGETEQCEIVWRDNKKSCGFIGAFQSQFLRVASTRSEWWLLGGRGLTGISMALTWYLMARAGWRSPLGAPCSNPAWDRNLFGLWLYENTAHTLATANLAFSLPLQSASSQPCDSRQRQGAVWERSLGWERRISELLTSIRSLCSPWL